MKRHFFWIGALLVLVFAFSSCRKKQHIEVNKEQIVFNSFGGTDLLRIVSDCDWSINTDNSQDWMQVAPLMGSKDTTNVVITAAPNEHNYDRSTRFTVVSSNGKVQKEIAVLQEKIDIDFIHNKIWFLRNYERWDCDYFYNVIPESYRSWIYYADYGRETWFFYFMEDNSGYEIRVQGPDTVYYPYNYQYYPEGDSLYIIFQTVDETIEDYHATIHELNNERFTFSDEWGWHEYEKLYLVNVSMGKRSEMRINPKKIAKKPAGPLIQRN